MKEASGEANMTVVTIVIIAIVLVAGGVIVTSMINKNTKSSNEQSGANCRMNNGNWKCS